ncbi:Protein of unknown function [Cotesia congregata]|uniref:Uncharacterized protein n=1 Tax=Cotesia congregata TaxID=51543 RepID=A0A8J2HC20_COTCN|nr:Protein of unknown function [Cotesia congregata]
MPFIWLRMSIPWELFKLKNSPTSPPPILAITVETAARAEYFHLSSVTP